MKGERFMNSRLKKAFLLAVGIGLFSFLIVKNLFSWPWSRDMMDTPMKKYGRGKTYVPEGVSSKGKEVLPKDIESIKNPIPPTPDSVKKGEILYMRFCAPCHGKDGSGRGPVAQKFIPAPAFGIRPLSDGFIYSRIAQGGAVMPAYRRISPEERWHIVNFIRKKFGVKYPEPITGGGE